MIRIAAGIFLILAGAGVQPASGLAAFPGELLPGSGFGTDPDYSPTFHMGDLAFRIPNRYLAFPWLTGDEPFDPAVCADSAEVMRRHLGGLCANSMRRPEQMIFLKLPARGPDGRGVISGGWRNVSVRHWGPVRLPGPTDEEFAARQDERWTRRRVEVLDTADYAAFHDTWTGDSAKQASPGLLAGSERAFAFISKSGAEPRAIWCNARAMPVITSQMWCTATIAFLTDTFPQNPDGTYPFVITYEFSGAEIDQAAAVGAAVASTVSGFRVR